MQHDLVFIRKTFRFHGHISLSYTVLSWDGKQATRWTCFTEPPADLIRWRGDPLG